jgi:hypothetical protein
MLSVAVFVVAIAAIPAVLILGLLVVLGSIVAALTEGGFSIVRPPQS